MAVNDIYRASCIFGAVGADGDLVFTVHYRTTNVTTPISRQAEAQEIADELGGNVETVYMPLLPSEITFDKVDVIGITDDTVIASYGSGAVGTDAGQPVPLRSAPVIKLQTGLRGRSFNGRMFLMPPSESQQDGGVLAGNYIAALALFQATIQRISLQPSGNIYDQTIYSRTKSNPPVEYIDNLVSTAIVNPTMGGQRGRQKV